MKLKDSFHPYAWITIFFWSLAYVFTQLGLECFSAFSLGFLRYLVASAALVVVAIVMKLKPPKARDIPLFIAAGASGFFLYMITFNHGAGLVTAATGSVVMATVPLITALFASFVYREKLTALQWTAIALEFVGVTVLTLMNSTFSVNQGLFWLMAAALVLASYNLLQRKLTKKYNALQASTYSIFFGTALLAVFAPGAMKELAEAPPVQYFYLLVLGVGCSAIAYVSWAKAFAKAKKTSHVSNYMFLTSFLTALIAFVVSGEIPDRATIIGGGIILFGVMIFNFGEGMLRRLGLKKN